MMSYLSSFDFPVDSLTVLPSRQSSLSIPSQPITAYVFASNDPRLMQESPELIVISNALERPVGQCAAYGVVSIGAVVGTMLAAAKRSQAAIKVASVAFMFLIVFSTLVIWKCGMSLLRAINGSLQNCLHRNSITNTTTAAGEQDNDTVGGRIRGDPSLLAARKKTKKVVSFTLQMGLQAIVMLIFAVSSKYGTAAPLILFGIPMGFMPLLWHGFNVQLHAGRSQPSGSQGIYAGTSGELQPALGFGGRLVSILRTSLTRNHRLVVPT